MTDMPLALLVAPRSAWTSDLKTALQSRGMAVYCAANCARAALLLRSHTPPHLVFTDLQLPDGSWSGILSLAERGPLPVNVIVVSSRVDIDLYSRVMEHGAFDFIVPPFEAAEVDHIIRSALGNAVARRQFHRTMEREECSLNAVEDGPCPVKDGFEVSPRLQWNFHRGFIKV